jgi:hemolysin activation/secretion protein
VLLIATAATRGDVPPTPGSVRESLPGARFTPAPATPAQIILPDQSGPTLHDRNGKRFQVHAFHFVGNTAFSAQRLKRVVGRYLDLELNLYDLNVAADAVTEFYHDRGYTLARAVVPPQKVVDGVVTLTVVEGRVGQVLFSGQKRYSEKFLRSVTGSLAGGELVTTDKLERSLLLLNDLPGLKVRATLSPGSEFGATDVLVKMEENFFNFNLAVDNSGRKETGRLRTDIGVDVNNPLGIGDQLTLRGLATDRGLMKYQKVGYSLPLNGDGLRASLGYSEVRYDVAGVFAPLGLDGLARTGEVGLQYQVERSRARNATWSLGYRDTRLIQRAFKAVISSTKLRITTVGYQFNQIGDDASVTNVSMQLSSNFKKNADGLKQDAEMGRLEADGNYLLPLDRQWDVYLRGDVVFSNDRLPDSEKFSIGGPGSVRAYRPSELRGDSGVQGTVEFRRSLVLYSMASSLSLFADAGRVIYKAPGFKDAWDSAAGVGIGLTVYPSSRTTFKIEAATVAGGRFRAADGEKGRVWASFSANF